LSTLWLIGTPLQLAAAYFSPREGSKYAKRLHIFEIVATLVFSNKKPRSVMLRDLLPIVPSRVDFYVDFKNGIEQTSISVHMVLTSSLAIVTPSQSFRKLGFVAVRVSHMGVGHN